MSMDSPTRPIPSRADQPGVGRAANPSHDPRFGITPKRSVLKVKNSTTRLLDRQGRLND